MPQGKPVITTPLIRKLSRAKKRAHSKNSPSWKAISKLLSIKQKEQLANQTSDNVNNAIHGSKNWWMNVKDLIGESPQVSFCPLISMNNRWLNMTQFVNELNSYYLSDHDGYIPDFSDIHLPKQYLPAIKLMKWQSMPYSVNSTHPNPQIQKTSQPGLARTMLISSHNL